MGHDSWQNSHVYPTVYKKYFRFMNKIAYDYDYNGLAVSSDDEGSRLGKLLCGKEGINNTV